MGKRPPTEQSRAERDLRKNSPALALGGRIGGLTTAARHDPRSYTANARRAFLDRFQRLADPDNLLDPAERDRRAVALRKAYFARLALQSAQKRRARRRPGQNRAAPQAGAVAGDKALEFQTQTRARRPSKTVQLSAVRGIGKEKATAATVAEEADDAPSASS